MAGASVPLLEIAYVPLNALGSINFALANGSFCYVNEDK